MKFRNHHYRLPYFILSMPFIYAMIIPGIILDICTEIYHRICFKLYGIAYVKRREYIRIDRHRLSYLSFIEKINCMYCGYMNGLFHYVSEIAAQTEKYWCAIKHKNDLGRIFYPPAHHDVFADYDNKAALTEFLEKEEKENI